LTKKRKNRKGGAEKTKEIFKEKLCLNERGDKIMMIYKSKDSLQYARLVFDKNKTYKQDTNDFKSLKETFPSDDATGKYTINIHPTLNDFIILAQNSKRENGCVFVFFNEQFITKTVSNP
jgi:hypothetical protein